MKFDPRAAAWALGLAWAAGVVPAEAETQRAAKPLITMEQALSARMPQVNDVRWLSGATQVVGTWRQPEARSATLEVWNVRTGARRTLAQGRLPSVSPDERWIVYLDRGRWQLMSLSDGSVTALGEEGTLTAANYPPRWSRDSRYIAIVHRASPARTPQASSPQASSPEAPSPQASRPQGGAPETTNDVRVVDVGQLADASRHGSPGLSSIALFDIRQPSRPARSVPVTDGFVNHGDWGAGSAYYFVALQPYWRGQRAHTSLRRLDAETLDVAEIHRVQDGFMQRAAPRVSPDGRLIALALDVDVGKWEDYVSLVTIDAQSGALHRLTREQFVGGNYVWAADGRSLYFGARQGGLSQIFEVDLAGRARRLTDGRRSYVDLDISADGRWLVYRSGDAYANRDVRIRSLRDGRERIVAVTADAGAAHRLGRFELVRWATPDGVQLYGYLFFPPDFDPRRKYPAFIDVHGGGPSTSLALSGTLGIGLTPSALEWHAWAAEGYVVFVPDMRSSGEYGPRLAAKRYAAGTWDSSGIEDDASDVESGTRWLIQQGHVDPSRVALFGHSAGGARVNLLLTRSRLYGAGIIHDPIASGALPAMVSQLSGAGTGVGFDESYVTNGVRLQDDPSVYTGGFLFDGYKSRTPTLILVGNPDKGATTALSAEILFSVLRQYGVPARMLRYMDDGHTPETLASAMHRYREIRAWLEKHIPAPRS